MFYSTEILSHKNKTELSILYYISTTDTLKNITRKDILNMDLQKLLNEILNTKIPFALRLYSYLLKGLVKVWMLKIKYYKIQIKNLNLTPKQDPAKQLSKKPKLSNDHTGVNLQINEDVISDLEESCASSFRLDRSLADAVSYLQQNNLNNYYQGLDVDFEYNHEVEKTNNKRIIPLKTYNITISDNFIMKEVNNTEFQMIIPNLISSYITNQIGVVLTENIEVEHQDLTCSNLFDLGMDEFNFKSFQDMSSIEDPRISSTLSAERDASRLRKSFQEFADNNSDKDSKAYWFYSLLVLASKGLINVSQVEMYGEISVQKL